MALLRPLLMDSVPEIQQSAALALGRLANYSEALAEMVVINEVLPQLVFSLAEKNRFYKKTAAFVLKSVAKHSPELAQAVVDANALDALVGCLSEFEPSVREAASWALGYIARHTPELAHKVVAAGAVPQLVLCLQEPELSLKRIAVSTLSEIAKHNSELAQFVVDAVAVPYLVPMIQHPDAKLKRQVCACLAHIAKHTVDLAEVVVEAEVIPKIFPCLKDADPVVKRNTATCLREIVKHTTELAESVVRGTGHSALVDYMNESKGAARLPAIMAVGYIAAFSETLAHAMMAVNALTPLKEALIKEPEDHIKAAAAWSIGQIGRHTPDTAKAVALADCLRPLIDIYKSAASSADLKKKAQTALKLVLQKCTHTPSLEPLLENTPDKILRYVVIQFSKVLPNSAGARKSFVQSDSLRKIQVMKADEKKNKLHEPIAAINSCFNPEIILFYSPNYPKELLKKLEAEEATQGGGQGTTGGGIVAGTSLVATG